MKLLWIGVVLSLLSIMTTYGKVNLPYNFDEMREEIKEMALAGHNPAHSYTQARGFVMQKVHLDTDKSGYFIQDVYCKIKYRAKVSPNSMPNHEQINVEHTWPKSRFGSTKGSSKYSQQVSDLHHLYPSDSRTNSLRANHNFTQFDNDDNIIQECPFSKQGISESTHQQAFEPPEEHKGNVARALFYFAVRYNMRISQNEEFFLRQWNIIDPVDHEEIERNDKIEKIQGNRNPFVDDPDLANLISDF